MIDFLLKCLIVACVGMIIVFIIALPVKLHQENVNTKECNKLGGVYLHPYKSEAYCIKAESIITLSGDKK